MASEVSGRVEAGNSGTTIEIIVKMMDSQIYTLQVDKQMSVPALKECIASVTGVATDHQRLIFRGKVLKDDQLLSAYNVEDGHTLHLVVREPAVLSSENLPVDSVSDRSSNGNRVQFQFAPGIVVETFNLSGQGDIGLSDVSRIVSDVLGSMGITNTDQAGDRHEEAPIPGMRSSNDWSRLQNAFGIAAGISSGSVQAPVMSDAFATLSQYLTRMREEILNSGNVEENSARASSVQGNGGASSYSAQSENALPTPASLAELLSTTRQMLNQMNEECLLQLARQLQNQENLTDSVDRANVQSGALRTGILLQHLGAYFLELGRAVMTLRLGRSPSEAVVNAGPAVFISPSGPNPLMVQPGASFGSPPSENLQSGSGLTDGLGAGFVSRCIDIQIHSVPSIHQTEPAGSQQSSGQTHSSPIVIWVTQNMQPASGISDSPLSSGMESQVTGDMQIPEFTAFLQNVGDTAGNDEQSRDARRRRMWRAAAANYERQRESVRSPAFEIDIFPTGEISINLNAEELMRGLSHGIEVHVESFSAEGAGVTDQAAPSGTVTEEAEPRITEEGLFLSRMLQQLMPFISQDPEIEHAANPGGDTSLQRDNATSSAPTEDSEVGTSRRRDDHNPTLPNPKRQKKE